MGDTFREMSGFAFGAAHWGRHAPRQERCASGPQGRSCREEGKAITEGASTSSLPEHGTNPAPLLDFTLPHRIDLEPEEGGRLHISPHDAVAAVGGAPRDSGISRAGRLPRSAEAQGWQPRGYLSTAGLKAG